MKNGQFLGVNSLIDTEVENYLVQIAALERTVLGKECTADNALEFLSTTYHLGMLYRQVERISEIERLIALVSSIKLSFPGYEDEFRITLNLLQETLYAKQGLLKYRRRYLDEVRDYAIRTDNAALLAIALNKLGFYYNNLYQNDVACVYYLLSIYVCFAHRSDYSQKQYNALVLHPVMNLITTMGERNRHLEIKAKLFNSPVLDNQSRLLLGGILEDQDDKVSDAFQPEAFAQLRTKLYGVPDWRSIHSRILCLYRLGQIDRLRDYYTADAARWDDNERLLALFRLHDEGQSDFVIDHLTPDLYFRHSDWIHKHWDDFSIDAQDHILELMIYDVRQFKAQLSYVPAQTLFDAIQRGRALYTPERLGHIMLTHSGTNHVYERAYAVVDSVSSYCGLPKGKEWIRQAIAAMGFEADGTAEGLLSAIETSLEKHCTFFPHYNALIENMFLLRKMISGREQFNLYQTLIRRTRSLTRRNALFEEFYRLNPSLIANDGRGGEAQWEPLFRDYTEKDGYAVRVFTLLDYSSQNHQETKVALSVEQAASLAAADRQVNIGFSGIGKSPEYLSCIETLKAASWKINEMDINRNFLLLEKNGETSVVFFMLEAENIWWADEAPFNEGVPKWFSLTTSIVSPVFRIKQYSSSYNSGNNRLFVILVPPAYIVNADTMRSSWDGVIVSKLASFTQSIARSGCLPEATDYEDLCAEELLGARLPSSSPEEESSRKDIVARILNNREGIIRQYEEAAGSPWNFSRIYLDYRYNPYQGLGDTSVDEHQYDLGNSAFMQVLNKLGMSHLAQMGTKDVHFVVYLRRTSAKLSLWARVTDNLLSVDSFKVESYRSDELKYIDRKNSDPREGFENDQGEVFLLGNIAEDECAIIYHLKPGEHSAYRKLGRSKDKRREIRQSIRRMFCDALVAVGEEDLWRDSFSALTGLILHNEVKVLAEKTAQTAIMARNMSHNLGSHVMAYLKRDLSSAKEIFDKGLLRDFYPFTDLKPGEVDNPASFLSYVERHKEHVELPFLLGLGKFISYLQERQDFIATVATNYIPYFSEINFGDDVFDVFNLDYRFLRSGASGGGRQENILLKYIALSEGLSRTGPLPPAGGNIVIRFRKYDGLNDYRDQANRGLMKPKGPGRKDLESLRGYLFHMPGGIVGRQALFSIMENIIRNSAKHGNWRSDRKNLEFTFDIYSGRSLGEEGGSADLYRYLAGQAEWKSVLADPVKPLDKYYILTITDNLPIRDTDFQSIQKAIKEDYVDENSVFIDHHKGIKEIRISAAWLRGIANDLHRPAGEPPVVTIRKAGGHLQYVLCVFAPRKVVIIADTPEEYEALVAATRSWEGWYVTGSKDYILSNYKTATVIAVRNGKALENMLRYFPDRVTGLEDGLYHAILSGEFSEEEVLKELIFKMYRIDPQDGPILISDGRAGASVSEHIHVVGSDTEAEGVYHYAYRTHHGSPEAFKNYMQGALRKEMLSVEGVSGNNSTDRLIRSERLDDIWYCKHLNALRTRVAVFDERLFSKITGLGDEQLLALPDDASMEASTEVLIDRQKRLWVFSIIARPDREQVCFDVFGLIDSEDVSACRVGRIACIQPTVFDCEYGTIPQISLRFLVPGYEHFFDYISIHQGIFDKIYDGIDVKNVVVKAGSCTDVIAAAKCGVSACLNNAFQAGGAPIQTYKDIQRFHKGFFIHSGRSKPSDYDMPQKIPFIQFSAIENAIFDCKYSLVELMKSAYYEYE